MLEKPLLPEVCRTKIGRVQKRLVSRDMTGRDEFFRQQRITMDRHALMRRPRAHRVNRIRSRSEPAKPPQRSLGLAHTRIDFFGGLLLGMGKITSQTLGTRFSGSSVSNSCRKVEPLRGIPIMK